MLENSRREAKRGQRGGTEDLRGRQTSIPRQLSELELQCRRPLQVYPLATTFDTRFVLGV
jgi:hypothetical protein